MKFLRTPDSCFANLPDFPFKPQYAQIKDTDGTDLRLAWIDEGPREATPVLLLHGEPSWSFLYRKIIALLVAQGHRVVAPDLIGFGRSDKPTNQDDYSYERHVAWISTWLELVDLKAITLFCQDWGGLIGLRLVAKYPGCFDRVIVANTGLPVGTGASDGFQKWLDFSQNTPEFPVGFIVNGGTVRELDASEIAAYDAPFPEEKYKAGARVFPTLVPITPEHASVAENKVAWNVLADFEKPFVLAFSDQDPVTKGGDKVFIERVRGTKGQAHTTIQNAGHFLQEDQPETIANLIHELIG